MMTKLSVNLNAVAMLRNRRDIGWPSVTGIARVVLQAGANGITVHPRPDQRHIRDGDVSELAAMIRAEFSEVEYNIEGYPDQRFLKLVEQVKPDQVTFVPDDPDQATSDHGWDIGANEEMLRSAIARMKDSGFRVVLFADADHNAPQQAMDVGADRIELYTGPFAANFGNASGDVLLENLANTAKAAKDVGIGMNAGHDLTLENIPSFLSAVENVAEVSIGHGITADALLMGFAEAVRRYKALLD
ncbi:MAG: pyridoxine 5'-phosphate synthase [Devosiaceae bacterium]|nr:pyridoxine 5'-phosphate synthase [Devosiaceae bacterium]